MVTMSKQISGTHSLTGKSLRYTVESVYNPESADLQGRWTVKLNGKTIRWYAMRLAAERCVRKAKVGAYGITFGEAF